jgi:ribosomal protein S18 acetylase RimI-like enzyme
MPPPVAAAAAFGISYREMTDADLPFVAALYATTRAREIAATGWPPEMQAAFLEQQHRAQHASYRSSYPDAEWLLIERGGEAIGRLYLARQEDMLLLIDVSLLPTERGAGLGTAILTDLLAGETGAVQLHVERTNAARRLYARLGFEIVEEQAIYLRMVRPAAAKA